MAKQRVDRDDTRLEQSEKNDIELSLITQLDQRPITRSEALISQALSQMSGLRIDVGVAQLAFATDQRNRLGLRLHLGLEQLRQRLTAPVTGLAIARGKFRGPGRERHQTHSA